ncbi:MAG TPA: hypothetical protein VKP66_07100 [Steroidobacteraceae bacterium]|nr:hypothetical protein [Steroidobacteraceae bacterium]
MVADGSTDFQERPKIVLVRYDNPPALTRHVRDLIEVAADSAKFSDSTFQCQQLVARKRRFVRCGPAKVPHWRSCARERSQVLDFMVVREGLELSTSAL